MPQSEIIFVTCKNQPELLADDQALVQALCERGHQVIACPWEEVYPENPLLKNSKTLVFRATWNYWTHFSAFKDWLHTLTPRFNVFNSKAVVLENLHKTYLKDLASAGIPIVPTQWLALNDLHSEDQITKRLRSFEPKPDAAFVLKPSVSGNAHLTFSFSSKNISELFSRPEFINHRAQLVEHGPAMLQPEILSVRTEGEFSLLFFGGKYSHTVLKVPSPGDFRVQASYGGKTTLVSPPNGTREIAENTLQTLSETPLYARVDLVRYNSGWALMELELVEPNLYCSHFEPGAKMFASELISRL